MNPSDRLDEWSCASCGRSWPSRNCGISRRAASLCNLSQPAVSHQIALLEEELGAKLLNRAARRVSLTVAGEVFLEEARRILGAVDRAHERMQEVARGAVGRIRLGATPTPGLYLLPPLLANIGPNTTSYDLRFEIGPIHAIAERVARNDLDMAIVAGALPSGELAGTQPVAGRTRHHRAAELTAGAGSDREAQSARSRNLVAARGRIRHEPADRRRGGIATGSRRPA